MDEQDRFDADVGSVVTTDDAIQETLGQFVIKADSNGADVDGGWPVERTDAERAWEVEITEISRRSTTRSSLHPRSLTSSDVSPVGGRLLGRHSERPHSCET